MISSFNILVKDKQGNFRLLRGNQLVDLEEQKNLRTEERKNNIIGLTAVSGEFSPGAGSQQSIRPVETNKPVARHWISPEDEEEADQFRDSQAEFQRLKRQIIYQKAASQVIANLTLSLTAEDNKRLEQIVFSRLKGLHSLVETKSKLLEPREKGGFSLKQEEAEKIIEKIEAMRASLEEGQYHQAGGKDKDSLAKKEEVKEKKPLPSTTPTASAVSSVNSSSIKAKAAKLPSPAAKQKPPSMLTTPLASNAVSDIKIKRSPPPSTGPSFQDVKKTVKIVGPIEELKFLTIEDWRRLGKTPQAAAQKIYEKIDLLGDESLLKKAQGIKAWKDSAVYKAYLEIGHRSLQRQKPIEEVIKEMEAEGQSALTLQEFEAIVDLSKKLQF